MNVTRLVLCGLVWAAVAFGATYEVGPGKPLIMISEVPWESLDPGDRVLIHWQPHAYKEKWVICAAGTAEKPVVVRGVPGPRGQPPVIDGADAVTRPTLNFWNESRGVIKIGGSNTPKNVIPSHVVVENLEIRGGKPGNWFTGRDGRTQYKKNAAAIYVEVGSDLVVRNCILTDCGNGFFAGGGERIVVDGCRIYGNGLVGNILVHNLYTACAGLTVQNCWMGPLRPGARGNNLKDRSAGLVVRYNWIEGGNRQLDLVDAEDDDGKLARHADWGDTFVYGNILVERDDRENRQIVHYGGDMGNRAFYRKGTLHFYHNTVISHRQGRTTLFRLSSADQQVDCRNNLLLTTAAGGSLILTEGDGKLAFGVNYANRQPAMGNGQIVRRGDWVIGDQPGFVDYRAGDLRLQPQSPCRGKAGELAPAVQAEHRPVRAYRRHQASTKRQTADSANLGAL